MTECSPGQSQTPFLIKDVIAVPAVAVGDGELSEAVSVGLVPSSPAHPVAWGDCIAGSTVGSDGRVPAFHVSTGLAAVERVVGPALKGRTVRCFRDAAGWLEALRESVEVERPLPVADLSRRTLLTAPLHAFKSGHGGALGPTERMAVERPLHSAVHFGTSQALLQAAAWARGLTMAEVIADEWGLAPPRRAVALHVRPGADLRAGVNAMIEWRLASLPLARFDDILAQLGQDGGKLTNTIRSLRERLTAPKGEEYQPVLHFDLHGALGTLCNNEPGKMLGQLYGWEAAARPCRLRIEDPLLLGSLPDQVRAMRTLRDYVRARHMSVQLVAGAWVGTLEDVRAFVEAGAADLIRLDLPALGSLSRSVEAILACEGGGVGAVVAGTSAETGLSARAALHVALGSDAELLAAGFGMGVDGAASWAQAEMARVLRETALHKEGLYGHRSTGET